MGIYQLYKYIQITHELNYYSAFCKKALIKGKND